MSYLLRHNPENLKMDSHGFVDLDELIIKLQTRYKVKKKLVLEIIKKSERKRFQLVGKKIRALYGHTVPVKSKLDEDKNIKVLYHGTTPRANQKILKEGLKPLDRNWVHLSPTQKIATEVASQRTSTPKILEIDVEAARRCDIHFYKVTEKVYISNKIPAKFIKFHVVKMKDVRDPAMHALDKNLVTKRSNKVVLY